MKNNQSLKVPPSLNGISPKDRSQYYDGLFREVKKLLPPDVFFVLCVGIITGPQSFTTSVLGNASEAAGLALLEATVEDMKHHTPILSGRSIERN